MAKICEIAILGKISLFSDILAEYSPFYPKYRYYKKKGRPKNIKPKAKKEKIKKIKPIKIKIYKKRGRPMKMKEEDLCKKCRHDPNKNKCEAYVRDVVYTTDGDKIKECKFYKESKNDI